MLSRASLSVLRPRTGFRVALVTPVRNIEYWSFGVTHRTQPFAQGDKLPQVDNTRLAINQSTGEAAAVTGNHLGIAYNSDNIFSVEGFSALEKEHYVPLRGLDRHRIDPVRDTDGPAAAKIIEELLQPEVEASLTDLWWNRLLKDFPSLKKPCNKAFREAWQNFYISALNVAHKEDEVKSLATPFLREQMQKNYISYAMVWRIAERLSDALEAAPFVSKYERRTSRVAVERVTKIMLDTVADEPWAHQDTTNPLLVDISNFRAWHEAGNW